VVGVSALSFLQVQCIDTVGWKDSWPIQACAAYFLGSLLKEVEEENQAGTS